QVGRRVDQLGGAGVRADGSSGGRRGGGHPGRQRQVERTPAGGRRAEAGRDRVARRTEGVSRAELLEVLAAGRLRVHRGDSADIGWQVQEERAARALQGSSCRRMTRPRRTRAEKETGSRNFPCYSFESSKIRTHGI